MVIHHYIMVKYQEKLMKENDRFLKDKDNDLKME